MKISAIDVTLFTYPTQRCADSAGHSHPGPENDAQMALLTLTSEEGDCGYAFAPPEVVRSHVVNAFFRKVLIGQNAFDRSVCGRIWCTGSAAAPISSPSGHSPLWSRHCGI